MNTPKPPTSLKLSDFSYELPAERIAQTPAEPRDSSKLLVLNRETGKIEHKIFRDILELLTPNDVLVVNDSKTVPMRVYGKKESGGLVEVLFIKRKQLLPQEHAEIWEVLTKPGLKVGQIISFSGSAMKISCLEVTGYTRLVKAEHMEGSVLETLHHIGQLPLPHYIHHMPKDPNSYQTVYAVEEGSSATPTAGLHFTPELLEKVQAKGIPIVKLTLHVGLGTFLPVKVEDITQHEMHREWMEVLPEDAALLNKAKKSGKRIIAVGTTSSRVLESCVDPKTGMIEAQQRETNLYIYPPRAFRFVDALITNFHLPESTLLMLLSAFCSAPNTSHMFTTFLNSTAGKAYSEAITKKYRFFSFGDAMFIHGGKAK